jgi:leucyl-tRNA synthetase
MFLGPLEQFKPWNTNGIDGVYKFLRKLWRLYHDKNGNFSVSDAAPSAEELKSLHKIIKKFLQSHLRLFSLYRQSSPSRKNGNGFFSAS